MGIKVDGIEIPLGVPGIGVPAGGETGKVLLKKSSTNYDTEWGVPDIPLATEETKGTVKSSKGTDHVVVAQDGTMSVTDVSVAEHAASADMVMNKLTVGKISSVSDGFEYDGSEPETLLLENLAIPVSPASGISDYNNITKACIGNIRDGNNINNRPNSYVSYYESINYGSILNIAGPYNNSSDQMQLLAGSSNNNALFFRTGYPLAANPRWNPWCQIITDLNSAINPNLAINYDFRNPVNQVGQTTYNITGYTIDNWYLREANTEPLTLTSDGIHVVSSGDSTNRFWALNQRLEFPQTIMGKTVTMSMYISQNNNVGTLRFSVVASNGIGYNTAVLLGGTIQPGFTGLLTITGVIPTTALDSYTGINIELFHNYSGRSGVSINMTISAVKLEYGTRQTLCRRNSSGQWEICDVPDYGEQLAKCQRYFQVLGKTFTDRQFLDIGSFMSVNNGKGGVVQAPIPVSLRTLPGIVINGNLRVHYNTGSTFILKASDFTSAYREGFHNLISFGQNTFPTGTNAPITQTMYYGNIDNGGSIDSYIYLDARL